MSSESQQEESHVREGSFYSYYLVFHSHNREMLPILVSADEFRCKTIEHLVRAGIAGKGFTIPSADTAKW